MTEAGPGERTVLLDGLANARDLGGLRRGDGTLTPRGVFFRSDNVDRLSPTGWGGVHAAGIRTVVDLRQPWERDRDVSPRPAWLTSVAVDLDGLDNRAFWKDYWDNGLAGTPLYYLPHLRAMPERAVSALSAIVSAPPGGVLFHCMGGRDRTGLIAMLLLALVEVEPEEIVDDYLETVRRGERRDAGANHKTHTAEELCHRHGTTTEDAFRNVVRELDPLAVLDAGEMGEQDRDTILTWRGTLTR